jgi:hypothetical protein
MTRTDDAASEHESRVESHIKARLGSRIRKLRVLYRQNGLILQGSACTYYAKQLAQHSAREITNLLVLANEIEVC